MIVAVHLADRPGDVEHPDLREELREIATLLAGDGVGFLGERSNIIGKAVVCSYSATAGSISPARARHSTSQCVHRCAKRVPPLGPSRARGVDRDATAPVKSRSF